MELFRYELDPRSIPTLGESNGMTRVSPESSFLLGEAGLVLRDPALPGGPEGVCVNTHMQYIVLTSK